MEGGWPEGWMKEMHERSNGRNVGRKDCYWFSPIIKYKFRSLSEVKRFFAALETHEGDERKAIEQIKADEKERRANAAAKKKLKKDAGDS
mmetsp:Transcript_97285/g.145791  ORF Transcript_97285/g.145791 Transcript_97285/m.145791 type:complete len:90 (+) Transcript_97285:1325-1594(+)